MPTANDATLDGPSPPPPVDAGARTRQGRRPPTGLSRIPVLGPIIDLFSNVRFGIVLLVILFIYSSIGSAGIIYPIHPNLFDSNSWVHAQLRQFRPFEMTEFEWFHWWPFNLLVALLCLSMVVTTLRRIRFNAINLGVWMIHTGVIVLAIGSVMYFSLKIEGDAPIARRQVTATLQTGEGPRQVSFTASPGNQASLVAGSDRWMFEVISIDPSWELRSGDDTGRRAYSVNVLVEGPEGRFMRQLLAGFPEYTEDVLFTGDEQQPMERAIKARGTALVSEELELTLDYQPTRWFYLKNDAVKSWALYVRQPGDSQWVERPIHGLPLYNDFIASREDVIQLPGERPIPLDPIDLPIPAVDPADPFPEITLHATGYIRYAATRSTLAPMPGVAPGAPLAPGVQFQLALGEGRVRDYLMLALDSRTNRSEEGLVRFTVARTAEELSALQKPPTLEFSIPSLGIQESSPITGLSMVDQSLPFTPVGSSGYSWRVRAVEDEVPLGSGAAAVAIVELRTPRGEFRRWVFDDPRLTRDVTDETARDAHGTAELIDDGILVTYRPGTGRAALTLVAGPEPDALHLIIARSNEEVRMLPLRAGAVTELGAGLAIRPLVFEPWARIAAKPLIVPPEQRLRDAGEFFSQVKLEIPGERASFPGDLAWLPFHRYPFATAQEALRRFPFQPTVITLSDGRQMELLFSRRRHALPAPVALDEFVLTTHIGGFTGEATTIRNYTSLVRFEDGAPVGATPEGAAGSVATGPEAGEEVAKGWSAPVQVSVNDPIERDGWWYFQAQWDPPDESRSAGQRASAGLNYTVLGVGNREGVWVQLAGCIIAVVGMIYAFYIKPILKRRRLEAVEQQIAMGLQGVRVAGGLSSGVADPERVPPRRPSHAQPAVPASSIVRESSS
jgi:hypothetical protein